MEEKNIDETYLESILGKEEEKIVDRLVEAVMELSEGARLTTLRLMNKVCPGASEQLGYIELMEVDAQLCERARERGVKLDKSEHDGMIEGLPFNLEFVVVNL